MAIFPQEDIERLASMLDGAAKVAIVTHMNPDGDALGSVFAMCSFLQRVLRKDAVIALADKVPGTLAFLKGRERIVDFVPECDLVVCLDFNSFKRAGKLEADLRASNAAKVLIDHHLDPATEDFDLVFSSPDVSSACEQLYWLLMRLPQVEGKTSRLPRRALRALMTGMTTDTNNFANSVFPSTLRMTSELLEAGVDRDSVLAHLYNEYRPNRVRLMSHLLDNCLRIDDRGFAYVILTKETARRFGFREGETEGLVNIPLSVKKVKISIFLREDEGYYRVSVRSKAGVSANALARLHFNGGGHEQAAGGRLYFPEDIPDRGAAADYIEKVTGEFLCDSARLLQKEAPGKI